MKLHYKITAIDLLSCFVLFLLLAGCKSGPKEPNFLMNEQDFPIVTDENMPADGDNTKSYNIQTGDTVYFMDVSKPAKDVKERYWDLDFTVDGWESRDQEFTFWVYNRQGIYKVLYCANDPTNCIAKAIFVKERSDLPDVEPVVYEPQPEPKTESKKKVVADPPAKKPEVKFFLPNVYSTNTPKKEFDITVSISGITDKENINLTVDGKEISSFNYSKSKKRLTARVPLQPGENKVKVTARTAGFEGSDEVVIISSPEAVLLPSIQFTQPAGSSATTQSDKYEVTLVTSNVTAKNQLSLTVNGQPTSNFKFSPQSGELSANVSLKNGDNIIRATANTKNGKASQEAVVAYKMAERNPSSPDVAGILVSNYPNSTDCINLIRDGFSVTLTPSQDVELQSFKVYTDDCGGAKVTISGPQLSETFRTTLVSGRSQISFGDVNARLKAGNTYTLSLSPIGGYGNCNSAKPPAFHNLRDCSGVKSASKPALKVDQKGTLSLFDLKFLY